MDDARLVRKIERVEQLAHDAHGLVAVEGLVVRQRGFQVLLAADELHHNVGDAGLFAEIVDLNDIRVVEARDCLRLAHEAHGEILRGILVELAHEDRLDRDLAVQLGVEGLADDTHRTLADHPLDLVAT